MLILVHSKASHVVRRSAIRYTWGSLARPRNALRPRWPSGEKINMTVRLVFVLGQMSDINSTASQQISFESYNFQDILQGDFIDDYRNMTLKAMLGLKYVYRYCGKVPFILKSDDDMFIDLPQLLETMKAYKRAWERTFMGPLNSQARVRRTGKWALTRKEYPFEHFPRYQSGSAYIMTTDLAYDLYSTAQYVPPIFIDDVYITGILAKIVRNVTHVREDTFAFADDPLPSICQLLRNKKLALTNVNPQHMQTLWVGLRNPHSHNCKSEEY